MIDQFQQVIAAAVDHAQVLSAIFFRDSVVVIDERFEMRADTLRYDLANERVYFLGPTVIRTDTNRIYCESGYYDVALDQAVFSENAQYKSGERLAAADTIRYFGTQELYILEGQAFVAEGEFQRATAERISYFRAEDKYKLEGQATVVDSNRTVSSSSVSKVSTCTIGMVTSPAKAVSMTISPSEIFTIVPTILDPSTVTTLSALAVVNAQHRAVIVICERVESFIIEVAMRI